MGTASLSGKVILAGVSDASGVVVTLTGPATRVALSAADGTYSFAALPGGFYQVTAEVADSLERRQVTALSLADAGMATAADLKLTITGWLTGHVVEAGGGDLAGATVALLGTNQVATTDLGGLFVLRDIVLGNVTVSASLPGHVSTTAAATIGRGAAANAMLTLDRVPATLGTVQGRVSYFGHNDSSSITLRLIGGASASAATNGDYTLADAPGTYELVADAPTFPRNKLGTVTLVAGATIDVGTHDMSLYRRVADGQAPIGIVPALPPAALPAPLAPSPTVSPSGILFGPPVGAPGSVQFAVLDPRSGVGRGCVEAPLNPLGAEHSPDGAWALVSAAGAYAVIHTRSCQVITTGLTLATHGSCHFRGDSNAVICLRTTNGLMSSLDFRSGALTTMTASVLPTSDVTRVNNWDLVIGRNGANASLLDFDPLGETILSAAAVSAPPSHMYVRPLDIQQFSSTTVLFQSCPNCVAKIVHPDGSVVTTAPLTGVATPSDVTSFGTWFGYNNGGRVNLVRVSDGAIVTGALGSDRNGAVINDAGTRIAFLAAGPNMYVDSLTPAATLVTSDVLVAGIGIPPTQIVWLSDSRVFASSGPNVYLKVAGAATTSEAGTVLLPLPAPLPPPAMPLPPSPFAFMPSPHAAAWRRPGNVIAVVHRDAPLRTITVPATAFMGPVSLVETPDDTRVLISDPAQFQTLRAADADASLTLIPGFAMHIDFVTDLGVLGVGPVPFSHAWAPHASLARFDVRENFVQLPPGIVPGLSATQHPSLSISTASGGTYAADTYSAYFP
ncbi:MAG: hypothetical protein IT381_03040 [Deltaproteobacteria bacterium]|nr:hypothetical protein [Deltaproteobacteria bacterium]